VNLKSTILKRSLIRWEWDSFRAKTLLAGFYNMLFELEPSSELQEVKTQLIEFYTTSHPALKIIELGLFLLENGDFVLSDLGCCIEIKISGINKMYISFHQVLENSGIFMK